MLVRLYEDVERLARRGAPDAETAVLEQLDELAARLTTRLAATADPLEEAPAANATAAAAATSSPSPSSAAFHSPVKVVAELSALLFQEEGFMRATPRTTTTTKTPSSTASSTRARASRSASPSSSPPSARASAPSST